MSKDSEHQSIQKRTFASEIEHDKTITRAYLTKGKDSSHPERKSASGVYQRVLYLVQNGNLQITDQQGESISAKDNLLPTCSYLSHGSRILIELPEDSGETVMNWISSGSPKKRGIQDSYSPSKDPENPLYRRRAATHDVEFKGDAISEKKGFMIGVRDFLKSFIPGHRTKHYGLDLGVDDRDGPPDGEDGHLYIHYTPPSSGKKGAILIGVEGASPRSSKHSKTGASDPYSAMKGSIIKELSEKKELSTTYKKTKIPRKYGGMRISLSAEHIKSITTETKWQEYYGDFIPSTADRHIGKTDTYKAPSSYSLSVGKKILRQTVKFISLGFVEPYREEYEKEKKSKRLSLVTEDTGSRPVSSEICLPQKMRDLDQAKSQAKARAESLEYYKATPPGIRSGKSGGDRGSRS
jgi:hypothetical protein